MDTKPAQDWDVVWNYTMGFPEENGFEKTVVNEPDIMMEENGLHIKNNFVGDAYVRYNPSKIELQTCKEGIYEAEAVFQSIPNVKSPAGFRMILSDGEKGCQISTDIDTGPAIMYDNDVQIQKIKNIDLNIDYIFRIERIAQANKIYLNGELIHQSEVPSRNYVSGNRIFFQGSSFEAVLKSIKFKKIS